MKFTVAKAADYYSHIGRTLHSVSVFAVSKLICILTSQAAR